MRDWGRMEEVGRGLLRIRRELEALGSGPPVFQSDQHQFLALLPSRHSATQKTQGQNHETSEVA